ncbi:MAG TPA: hypothetical protein VFE33_17720 [Thermoanaerobaculia bacterium]|nr:hypothetical protein [Thermoanaerobaculia bacterium]
MRRPLAPHVQAALSRAAQPKGPATPAPGGGRPAAPHVQAALERGAMANPAPPAPRAAASSLQPKLAPPALRPVLRRASTVQRMEYTSKSVSKESNNNSPGWSFVGQGGEKLQVVDTGKRLEAYIDGEYVGYLSYEVDTDDIVPRMRFGYISIEKKKHRNKKLSSVLIFLLALKALQRNLQTICVGHPDPELKGYWEKIGFDFAAAQKKQHLHILSLYADRPVEDLPSAESVTVTEANAPTLAVLQWAQLSYNGYWKG